MHERNVSFLADVCNDESFMLYCILELLKCVRRKFPHNLYCRVPAVRFDRHWTARHQAAARAVSLRRGIGFTLLPGRQH